MFCQPRYSESAHGPTPRQICITVLIRCRASQAQCREKR